MEPRVALTLNGQSVNQDDFNAVARQAAMNAEYVWAQLLRLAPPGAATSFAPVMGIIPSGGQAGNYSLFHAKSLLGVSGANDAKITIQPFVAVIGSVVDQAATPTGAHEASTDGPRNAMREIRLAPHYGEVNKQFQTELQIPATLGNKRWDAIYAKVDVDVADGSLTRYTKTGDGPVGSTLVSVVSRTKVTIGRVGGVESAGVASKPAIPSDGGGSYHILLGYLYVDAAHTLTTSIGASRLLETFTPLLVSPANGGARAMPASRAFHPSGFALATEFLANTSDPRPGTYVPPSMVGTERRVIPIDADDTSGHPSCSPNAVTIIDDSIDWRKRIFTMIVEAGPVDFPWKSGGGLFATTYPQVYVQVASSFVTNLLPFTGTQNGHLVLALDNISSPGLASGAKLAIFVDNNTGNLCVWRNNVNAGRRILVILDASGRFANSDANGL